jgi:hypothetical protein
VWFDFFSLQIVSLSQPVENCCRFYVQGLLSNVQRKNAEAVALDLIDRAKANGIRVSAWTADQTDSGKVTRRQRPRVARRKSRPPLKAAPLPEAADFFTSKCMAPEPASGAAVALVAQGCCEP